MHVQASAVAYHDFPDGESYVRIECEVASHDVVIVGSLDHPTTNCCRSCFSPTPARDLGARRVGLVATYLAYMRQDTRFRPGEAITSRSFRVDTVRSS
jgi:ribose-phosphate pyrophosphokinase